MFNPTLSPPSNTHSLIDKDNFLASRLEEKCGICAVLAAPGINSLYAWRHTLTILNYLRHRGKIGFGLCVTQPNGELRSFHTEQAIEAYYAETGKQEPMHGFTASGHTRYATTGAYDDTCNIQPLVGILQNKENTPFSVSHNGNLTNFLPLEEFLKQKGFHSTASSDTGAIVSLMEYVSSLHPLFSAEELVRKTVPLLEGCFNLIFHFPASIIVARDPQGFRPLSYTEHKGTWFITSETIGLRKERFFDSLQFTDVLPGEIIKFNRGASHPIYLEQFSEDKKDPRSGFCGMEIAYFMQRYSRTPWGSIDDIRNKIGRAFFREIKDRDILPFGLGTSSYNDQNSLIVGIPRSGLATAKGFSEESGIRRVPVFKKQNSTVSSRSFTGHDAESRERLAEKKVVVNASYARKVEGKHIFVVDDTIVRGTTIPYYIKVLTELKAASIHIVIPYPEIKAPCHWGINISKTSELFSNMHPSNEKQRGALDNESHKVASVTFMSIEGFKEVMRKIGMDMCLDCSTGEYRNPTPADFSPDNVLFQNLAVRFDRLPLKLPVLSSPTP